MTDDLRNQLRNDLLNFDNDYADHYGNNETLALQEDAAPALESRAKEKGFLDKAAEAAGDVASDVFTGVRQAPRSIVRGGIGAIQSVLDIGDDLNDAFGLPELQIFDPEGNLDIDLLSQDEVKQRFERVQEIARERGEEVPTEESFTIGNIDKPADQSVTGDLIETVAQFAVGFKGVDKALKGLKVAQATTRGGQLAGNIGKGALADVVAFDEHEQRLSNVIEQVPALQNPVTEYLAADEDDSFLEGKLKQTIEGLTLGGFGDILFDGVRLIKKGRAAAAGADDAAARSADEVVTPQLEDAAGVTFDRTKLNVLGDLERDDLLLKTVKKQEASEAGRVARKLTKAEKETAGLSAEQVAKAGDLVNAIDNVKVNDALNVERTSVRDTYKGEIFATKMVKKDGDFVGGADLSILDDEVFIQNIEVAEKAQRQGVATNLVKDLLEEYPDKKINVSMITDEGASFFKKFFEVDEDGLLTHKKVARTAPQDVDIQINFARIEGPEDIPRLMQEMANDPDLLKSVDKARRGVQTDEELLKGAADVDGFQELMTRRSGEALNDQQTVAVRKLYYDTTEKLMEAAKKAASAEASDIDQFAFRKMVAVHHAVQQEVLGARAEAARALRAWSVPVQGGDSQAVRQIENLVNEFGGPEASKDLARRLTSISSTGQLTTTQINNVVNAGVFARSRKALEEAWTLGLLTSPRTHIVNIASNVLTGLTLGVERMSASVLRDSPIEFREGLEFYSAYFGSFKEALANGAEAWRTGQVGIGLGKIDLPPQRSTAREVLDPNGSMGVFSKAVDLYGAALNRYAGGALAAGDEFSKTLLYKSQLRSLAYRQGRQLGLTGEELKEHIAKTLTEPPSNLRADSIEFANYGTYTNALQGGGQNVQKAIARIPLARFVVPFVRTPLNIFKFTFERTPIGLLSEGMREDIAAGGLRRSQALAKLGTGTSVMYLGMDLSLNGQITGAGPSDPKVRGKLRSNGWQPYSVKIGDTYYSYARWEPFATWLGMSADMTEILTNYESYDVAAQDEIDELVTASVAAMANQVVGKTFLRGISDMTQVLSDSKRYGPRFLQQYAGSLVPTVAADIERAINPEVSQVFNMIDAMKARIPGLSDQVPPRRNVYGEVMKSFYPSEDNAAKALGERAMSIFNPVYFTDADKPDNPLDQYFLKNGFSGPNMPQKTQKFEVPGTFGQERVAIDLREYPEIYSRFLEKRGEVTLRQFGNRTMKEQLLALVNQEIPESRMFFNSRLFDHDKQEQHISNIVSEYDSQIRTELVEEFPVLRQTIAEERAAARVINQNQGAQGLVRERPFP